MKKHLLLVAFVLNFSMAFANDTLTTAQPTDETTTITLEEVGLAMPEDVQIDELVASFSERVEAFYVYDMKGNLVISSAEGKSVSDIPYEATFLMKEENVYYYILEK
ncbi:MAG: hypothetical protein NZ521_02895 [Flammeovirgaceae bacterium]|nr:hypothetical protein [Flammeovirgaceae bacterium]MDW8287106.1 hypothetical protein [Flammeovirgaceae bacterium]